jgi:hypothetical protein
MQSSLTRNAPIFVAEKSGFQSLAYKKCLPGAACRRIAAWVSLILSLASMGCTVEAGFPSSLPAPPLPPPSGQVIQVTTAGELFAAINRLESGGTVMIRAGDYLLDHPLVLDAKHNITLRGETGRPEDVVIHGQGWDHPNQNEDLLHVARCDGVIIADLTFAEARSYGVKVEAENGPRNVHIRNCHFRNLGMRAIKGSAGQDPSVHAVNGSVRFCRFENTRVPPADWLFDGDYISAIDMMALENWTFSDNTFLDIRGRNGGGRAAVFIWVRSRKIIVERNVIVDCDRGIALGNPGVSTANREGEVPVYVLDAVVRNNFIQGGADCGMELWYARNIRVLHNSICRPEQNWQRGIRVGTGSSDILIQNNLIHGNIRLDGGSAKETNNLVGQVDHCFADALHGDLSLNAAAVDALDKGTPHPEVTSDIRGQPRDATPDLGAWEHNTDR